MEKPVGNNPTPPPSGLANSIMNVAKASGLGGTRAVASMSKPTVIKSWYMERYESVVIQRNILVFTLLISFALIVFGVWFIKRLQESRTVDPFVIQIEEKTGIPTVVNPEGSLKFTANEAIKTHFVMTYIRAREEYTAESFKTKERRVFNMSSGDVARQYERIVSSSNDNSPPKKYGDSTTVEVQLRSDIIYRTEKTAQVRVRLIRHGNIRKVENKYIEMEFDFINLELTREQREENPLGFVVTYYTIKDDST